METLAAAAIRFGFDITWKATLLLALVLCLVAALRRASAAFRHLAAALGLAGVLALPFVALAVPRVAVPLLPSFLPAAPPRPQTVALTRTSAAAAAGAHVFASGPASVCPDLPAPAKPSWPLWAIAIWAAGALLASLRLVLGTLRVRAIARHSEPLCDPKCLEAAGEISRRLGLKGRVRIVTSSEVPVAMTAGFVRPVLLLNSCAPEWPSGLRRAVLFHELAHVRRWDWITFLLGELAVGLYWFHPLAWLLRRETRLNAERACDDRVIDDGTKPSTYAAHLLDVVRSFACDRRSPLPVMAMARPSQFEGRVRAILDPGLRRREPSGRLVRGAALGFLASVLALAALEPWTSETAKAAPLPMPPVAMAAVPAAVPEPSAIPAVKAKASEKTEGQTKPAKTKAKSKCRKKAARSGSHSPASA